MRAQDVTRREFLRVGGMAAAGLSLTDVGWLGAQTPTRARHCIVLFLVGGPSQLETWDPKPNARAEVRGPFKPIATNVPGMQICEQLPRLARLADKYALIRSVYHDEQPIHETGQQLLQTGHVCHSGELHPHVGACASRQLGRLNANAPAAVLLPGPISNTGVAISHGQSAGQLGFEHALTVLNHDSLSRSRESARYGNTAFGRSCLHARRLVEQGVRCVTVNMFDTVFNEVTWDCHADGGALATTLEDYKTTLCPTFDLACSALLEDLAQRGMLDETLVVVMGEFGRTPLLNYRGGRDHWTKCWSVMLAGGGIRGGQVIGRSDEHAAEPLDRPVHASAVAATMASALGIEIKGFRVAQPVCELFGG